MLTDALVDRVMVKRALPGIFGEDDPGASPSELLWRFEASAIRIELIRPRGKAVELYNCGSWCRKKSF
jgi:hypothetical protein